MSTATHGSRIDTATTASASSPLWVAPDDAREDQHRYAKAHQDQIPADPRAMLLLGAVLSARVMRNASSAARAHTSTVPPAAPSIAPRVVGDR